MPDLPVTTPQVAPQVQPGVDMPQAVDAKALGAGIGDAIGTMSEVGHKIWFDAKTRADQAATLDADNSVNDLSESLLRDPKTGLLNQFTGKDAPAATQQALSAFDDHVGKTMDSLANDQQKLSFQRIAQARRFEFQRTLDGYEHGQTEQYAKDVHDKAIAGTVTDAVNNAGNPEAVTDALARQKALLSDFGQGRMSQAAIDLQTQQHASATQLAVVEHLTATGNDLAAKSWYDAHATEFQGHDAIVAANMVKAGSLAGESQRWVDANTVDKNGDALPRAEIDAKVRAVADPMLRDEIQKRADAKLRQVQEEKDDADRKTFLDAAKVVSTSGVTDPRVVAAMAQLPPERQAQLRSLGTREIPEFSQDTYDLRRMVGTDAFLHADLTQWIGKVRQSQLDEYAKMQQEQRDKGTTGPKVSDVETDNRIVGNALQHLGLDVEGKERSDDALAFQNSYDKAKAAAVVANGGKPIDPDTKERLAKALAADHIATVQRAAYSPLRLISGTTTQESNGKLYTRPGSEIDHDLAPLMPVAGTYSAREDAAMSRADLAQWVQSANSPDAAQRTATTAQLERMAKGIAKDGSQDPALVRRYEIIRAAARAAKQIK